MNRYSRVFHHISIGDVKRNGYKKYKKNENFLESIRNARKFLRDMNSPNYSDWRCNKLKEGMNTDNVFVTTFPSTGDSNLENIDANNANAYTAAGGLDALNGTSIKSNGSGSGQDGGFNVGQSYLAFDGASSDFSRHAILDPIDSSKFDTMSIRAIVGNDSNGGEDPDIPGEELRLYYLEPNGSSFKSIAINPAGDQVLSADSDVIIALGDGLDGALQNFSISLPSYARGEGFTYMLYQLDNSGAEFDHYGITNIKYQRRSPVSLVVSLDSPEAVAFIRDGGNLTPAEKKKRLEDMLAASDEYMDTMFPTNQEAMRRAEQNLQRNIDISLDPDTFKFPEDPATWNELFPRSVTDSSSAQQIDRYMESKGLTFDTLTKDAINKNFDRSSQLNIINTSDVENRDKFLTALGIDVSNLNNLSDDTYRKLSDSKIYIQPGGTPSTGWDGKMYEYNSPELEKSRIVPLQTYLEAKKRDGYYGVERPDVAPPGSRYVMEKKYGFSSDDDVTPKLTGPQNETFKQQSEDATYNIYRIGSYGTLGYTWDLSHFEKGLGGGLEAGSNFARGQVIDSMTAVLNHMYNNRDSLAFAYANEYGADTTVEYDPLHFLLKADTGKRALQIASSSNAGQLYYPLSSFGNPTTREQEKYNNDREQDRRIANFKKAYDRIKSMSTDFASYDNDSWYVKNKGATGGQSDVTVGAPSKAHPYANANITQPTDPTQPDPNDPTPPEERDGYNYYPEFDDVEDIPSRLNADDIKPTMDDLGAAGFAAYKAGGGDAKVKEGLTVAQVIKQGQININAFNPGAPVQKPISNPKTQSPNLYKGVVQALEDGFDAKEFAGDVFLPAAEYRGYIASSILMNRPITRTATTYDKNALVKGMSNFPDTYFKTSNNEYGLFSVTKTPIPYADQNIRERPDGSIEVNPDPNTNNTTPVSSAGMGERLSLGFANPLAATGQAQVQVVVPDNNPNNAYLRYVDHAYSNLKSKDPGEFPVPTDSLITRGLSGLRTGDFMGTKPHTGGFKGYPPNIKGDMITRFDVPYSKLPPNIRKVIDTEINTKQLGSGTLSKTTDVTATDAATVSADNKKKKKTNAVAEMYEPKAKHNEKITKRMKSPKEFFKQADIKPVYPKDPPPEMVNGYHPDLVDGEKVSNRFNKLDPQSAKAMPATGNPNIDKKVGAAAKKPK